MVSHGVKSTYIRYQSGSCFQRTRAIEIRYESLVNDPLTEGERVIDHFHLRMNLRIRRQLQKADTRSIGVHQRLDSSELLAASKVAAKELQALAYVTG